MEGVTQLKRAPIFGVLSARLRSGVHLLAKQVYLSPKVYLLSREISICFVWGSAGVFIKLHLRTNVSELAKSWYSKVGPVFRLKTACHSVIFFVIQKIKVKVGIIKWYLLIYIGI